MVLMERRATQLAVMAQMGDRLWFSSLATSMQQHLEEKAAMVAMECRVILA